MDGKNQMIEFETQSAKVQFDDSPEAKEKAFQLLLQYFQKHEAFNGECICQMDNPQIDAPIVLSRIAEDAFKFRLIWKEGY